jgi:hypothetical protein
MITSLTEKTIDGVVIHERNKNDERKPLKFHRAIINAAAHINFIWNKKVD